MVLNFAKRFVSSLPSSISSKIYLYYKVLKLVKNNDSYLVQTGYINSFRRRLPVDINDQPLPWMNYSMIDFLSNRLKKDMQVFEYGSGYSSLFFADKVESVTAIEYSNEWFEKISNFANQVDNLEILFSPLDENYPLSIVNQNPEKKNYDVVIIDGRKRVKCARNALPFLKDNGVLILDDSDRTYYSGIFDFYLQKGYKELTIRGLKPTDLETYTTTIFYKGGNNCLQI